MKHYILLTMLLTGLVNAGETNIMDRVHRIMFVGDSLTDGSAWTDWVIATLQANGDPDVVKFDAGVAGDNVPK